MTINLTRPVPAIEVVPVPAPADPRDAMMHAFAVAETVVAQLADRPTTASLNDDYRGGYRVELYFHRAPDRVAAFAGQYRVPVSTDPDYGNDGSSYSSADVMVDGVSVRAWALVRVEAVAA
ncbi:hypothetical protein Q5762_07260 [Streptomyces sp. P9(2023)]|uniref:hypothetical protein n=1 Tax=Streptomyces sp. P9(2023) TaxID=3064394 RepID=UPI0028F43FC0|nr:hypothetical protein [Streptomyces sp. P9(2023)]MDT9688154.1 hypothetical protein [Streptomyces sp. P9(2023)]